MNLNHFYMTNLCCRHKLEQSFLKDPKNCLREADIIGVVHDVSHRWTREKLDIKIIELLKEHTDIPSILVLNKVCTYINKSYFSYKFIINFVA